jgi:hypothetical protein
VKTVADTAVTDDAGGAGEPRRHDDHRRERTSISVGDTRRSARLRRSPRSSTRSAATSSALAAACGTRTARRTVVRPSGGIKYVDGELTQDACASGRKLTFAKAERTGRDRPGGTPFASGSPRTASSSRRASPTRASTASRWSRGARSRAPAQYEVQWSKRLYPWATRGSQVTWATSLKLPLSPGTWYYRVRGLDYLMMGSKPQMSWSDPVPDRGHEAAFPGRPLGPSPNK